MYSNYEDEAAGGSFLIGMLAGVVLGAGLGLMFAPRAGAETRRRVTESAQKFGDSAKQGYSQASEKVHDIVDRSRETYDKARRSVSKGVEEARRYVSDAKETADDYASQASETIRSTTGQS
jgi:gas vesicle protein